MNVMRNWKTEMVPSLRLLGTPFLRFELLSISV
jgi:hypothetical protein